MYSHLWLAARNGILLVIMFGLNKPFTMAVKFYGVNYDCHKFDVFRILPDLKRLTRIVRLFV